MALILISVIMHFTQAIAFWKVPSNYLQGQPGNQLHL